MSYENKDKNNRPSSKVKTPINSNNSYNNKDYLSNKRKKVTTSEELEKELAEAESFLEKANKEFMNLKINEFKKENNENNHIDEEAIKFIGKTLEEKNILIKQSNTKIPLNQFLKQNIIRENSLFEDVKISPKNSTKISVAITNNNVENLNFDNNFSLSNPIGENNEFPSKEKNENLIEKDFIKFNNLMNKYRKQLKANGFPEIGIVICKTENDQELFYKFLDYILIKKSNENGDRLKLKKTCEELREKLLMQQNENNKLEKELQILKETFKKYEKDNQILNEKLSRIKDAHDKSIADLKSEMNKHKSRFNILQVEKKSFEEKYSKMAENFQKFFTKINQNNQNLDFHKPANLDITKTIKRNDLIKILSKVKGTEKLIETIKNGYNESLRELLFEISALKNFILEINNEIIQYALKLDLKGLVTLESNFINMPFLDAIPKIKYALKTNIKKSFDFWNLDNNNENYNNDNKTRFAFPEGQTNNSSNILNNRENISRISNDNQNIIEKNIKKMNETYDENIPAESISLIRGKNDSVFENDEKLENNINNNFNNSILNCDQMIDFDIDNIDLDDSNTNSIKIDIKNKLDNKEKIGIQTGIRSKRDGIDSKTNDGNFRKNNEKSEMNLIDNELEYLKKKWIKALTG